MLVSNVQEVNQLYIYKYPLFQILFPYRPLQGTEQSSLCYTVGSYQLSILYILGWCESNSGFCIVEICHLILEPPGFPGGASGKKSTCQFRRRQRCGFDPWVRNIHHLEPLLHCTFLKNRKGTTRSITYSKHDNCQCHLKNFPFETGNETRMPSIIPFIQDCTASPRCNALVIKAIRIEKRKK